MTLSKPNPMNIFEKLIFYHEENSTIYIYTYDIYTYIYIYNIYIIYIYTLQSFSNKENNR